MKVRLVLTVTNPVKKAMVINIRKILLIVLIWFLIPVYSQDKKHVQAEGIISYLTVDQVYCDIGSFAEVSVGDTLKVLRRSDEIGLLVVTNVARKSSITIPIVSTVDFQLGDRVLLDKWIKREGMEEPVKSMEKVPGKKEREKIRFSQNGILSLRYSWSRFSEDTTSSRSIGTMQYGFNILNPVKTNIWVYGRGDLKERDFAVYQARLTFGDNRDGFFLQLGRVFSPELSGVGATDGLLASYTLSSSSSIGLLGGVQPDPASLKFDSNVKKFGGFVRIKKPVKNVAVDGNLAVVSQYTGEEVDREFAYGKLRVKYRKIIDISMHQTVDFDRPKSNLKKRPVDITSNQISVRIRPFNGLVISSRYTGRKRVIYKVSGPELSDSLFDDELRSGWYNSIQYYHNRIGTIRTGVNLRAQSGRKNTSTLIFLNYRSRQSGNNSSITLATDYIKNMVISGLKGRLGYSIMLKNIGVFYSEYELYSFGYGNKMHDYRQHNISSSLSWQYKSKLQGSASLDYTKDADYSILFFYFGLSYRL